MSSLSLPVRAMERTLTELDHVRITRLIERLPDAGQRAAPHLLRLSDTLDNAHLVSSREVSPDVVTMYSQVLLADVDPATGEASGARRKLTVCYPADADAAAGFVSVLSPIGGALIGATVGSRVSWTTPDGATLEGEIVAILFQPEASGDFAL